MKTGWQLSDDENLLRGCREGDDAAWAEMLKRFRGTVYAACWRMGIDDSHSADVLQDTFLALHRSIGGIKSAEALPKWISVTASRLAGRYRTRSRSYVLLDQAENVPVSEDSTELLEQKESRREI